MPAGLELGGLLGGTLSGVLSDASIKAARTDPGAGLVGRRVQIVMAYTALIAVVLLALRAVPAGAASLQWVVIACLGFAIYGERLLPADAAGWLLAADCGDCCCARYCSVLACLQAALCMPNNPRMLAARPPCALAWSRAQPCALCHTLAGPQMLIGLCGAELISPKSVGASQGILGLVSYMGAAGAVAAWQPRSAQQRCGSRRSPQLTASAAAFVVAGAGIPLSYLQLRFGWNG